LGILCYFWVLLKSYFRLFTFLCCRQLYYWLYFRNSIFLWHFYNFFIFLLFF
jgi:hypothetical protein